MNQQIRWFTTGACLALQAVWLLPIGGDVYAQSAPSKASEPVSASSEATTSALLAYHEMRTPFHEDLFGGPFDLEEDLTYDVLETAGEETGVGILGASNGAWCEFIVLYEEAIDPVPLLLDGRLPGEVAASVIAASPECRFVYGFAASDRGAGRFAAMTMSFDSPTVRGDREEIMWPLRTATPVQDAIEDGIDPESLEGYVSDAASLATPSGGSNNLLAISRWREVACTCTNRTCGGVPLTEDQCSYYEIWCGRAKRQYEICLDAAMSGFDLVGCFAAGVAVLGAVVACVLVPAFCVATVGIALSLVGLGGGAVCLNGLWELYKGCENDYTGDMDSVAFFTCSAASPSGDPFPFEPNP